MNNLLNFFIKHCAWFIFAIYVILSLVLLFKDNPYQQSVYLTSANQMSAAVYKAFNGVTSYFHLRGINESLQERNARLEMELIELRNQMADLELLSPDSLRHNVKGQYTFVMAQVISNSIAQPNNYITINRGYLDGVSPEMGVIDQNGVVGIVNVAGPHAARVISLLNPHIRLSCKLQGNGFYGSLVWDGKDPRYAVLEELPRHVEFHKGDTVVTSGYSAVFPPGLIVGTIVGKQTGKNASFESLRVKLTTNFSQLSSVRVITNGMKKELDALLRAEQGIDTAANVQTRPEIKPEIVDVIPTDKTDKDKDKGKESGNDKPVQTIQPAQPVQPVEPVEPTNEPQP
ncbi:MAG: rod shape-determining protein MreC [Muribaculaceae bacterium]|nr:rod shape-determining protein MreC [Muribaculaceae bacterium]